MPECKLCAYVSQMFETRGTGVLNCPILCGQYKKEPLVGKIEF